MSSLARFYLWQGRRWNSIVQVLDGMHAGFWLGLLSRAQLEAADELHYRRSQSYNGEAHNLRGLMDWEAVAITGYFEGRARLTVLGAGGGREVLALERRGHQVDGFECNETLVAFAGEFLRRHRATAIIRPLERDAALPPGACDGLIMGWGSYMHIPGRSRRIARLRNLRTLVPEGAPLLLSFFTRPDATLRLRTAYRIARIIRAVLRREAPEYGDDLVPVYVHRFDRAEIEGELKEAGFRLARYEPQGRGPHDSGWAVGVAEPGVSNTVDASGAARDTEQAVTSAPIPAGGTARDSEA